MKIADKIKAIIASDPEVQCRRAQLKAIGYIYKHSNNAHASWQSNDKCTDVNAWRIDRDNRLRSIGYLKMKPLSSFQVGTSTLESLIKKFKDMFKVADDLA